MPSRLARVLSIALAVLLLVGAAPSAHSNDLHMVHFPLSRPVARATEVATTLLPPITFRVQTPTYTLDAAGLAVPGYSRNDAPGAPALPVWATVVELPDDGAYTLTYDAGQAITLTVAAPLPAVKVPLPIAPDSTGALPDFVPTADRPDPAIYAADAFYPAALVQPGPIGVQRGRRLLPLRVFPFQYNPVAGTLRYFPDVQVTVQPTPPGPFCDKLRCPGVQNHLSEAEKWPQPFSVGPEGPFQFQPVGFQPPISALRLRTGARGLYRLTWGDLVTAGVPVTTTSPATFAISYLGQPVDIQVTGEDDGRFDPGDLVIFYAEPYVGRYMTQNVYWFTWGGALGARIATRAVTPTGSEPVITTITQTLHIESNRDYRSLYNRPQDADHWFDTQLYPNVLTGILTATTSYTLTLDDPLRTGDLLLRAVFFGGQAQAANPDQSVALRLNGHAVGLYQWDGSTEYTVTAALPASWLDGAPDQVYLEAALSQLPGLGNYWVSPDWVEVTYAALADAETDQTVIEAVAPGANEVVVSGFTTDTVKVFDVRDARHPVQLTTVTALPPRPPQLWGEPASPQDWGAGGAITYTVHFWDADLPNPTYSLSADAALLAPQAIEPETATTWGAPGNAYDYIAIVHRSLWDAAQPLLDYRADPAGDALRVARVNLQDVYDEFSYGRVDPEAIRSFLTYAYHHWNSGGPPPRYVLLVGDGTYNFTGVSGWSAQNLIPPYLINVDPWLGETAADNRFVSVDGPDDYLPDMAIGRISAQTPAEVTAVVSKTLAYEALPPGDWQRRVVFVADNCTDPAGDFNAYSEEVRQNWLPAGYDRPKIYYGNPLSQCPNADYDNLDLNGSYLDEMRPAIRAAFNNQALLIQWFGHASQRRWGSVSMFNSIVDVPNLAPNTVWPFTTAYSCLAGYFIQDAQTLAEALTSWSPQSGSVIDLSPSGLHIGDALLIMNQGIIKAVFQDRIARVGDVVNAGKLFYWQHASSYLDVIDTSILFGDPALKLRLPPLPVTPTFLPLIETGQVKLTWTHLLENTSYEVWRSDQPYSILEMPASLKLADLLAPVGGGEMTYTDTKSGSVGDASRNYFYTVRGVNALGVSPVARWSGEFDFAIIAGQ